MNKEEIIKYLKNSISEKGNYSYSLPIETTKLTIRYIEDLEQRIDKAIEYNEHLIRDAKYHLNLGHLKKMKKILKGEE